jgi:ubiquinone biosynthesis protein
MSSFSDKFNRYRKLFGFILKYWNSRLLNQTAAHALEESLLEEEQEVDQKYPPEELVEDLQNLGPTFIKLGQLLSTRPDLLPDAYLKALAKLQDHVPPISYEKVRQIIEDEIGVKVSRAFDNFEQKPLASASIGQVHRARLRSGREVVVKVQRPGIRKMFLDDFNVITEITDFGIKYSETAKKYAIDNILEELRHIVINELDL